MSDICGNFECEVLTGSWAQFVLRPDGHGRLAGGAGSPGEEAMLSSMLSEARHVLGSPEFAQARPRTPCPLLCLFWGE